MGIRVGLLAAVISCLLAGPAGAGASQPYTWQNVKIINGGLMPGIVMHPTERGLMYIRGNVGGVYRWDAPAHVWTPLMDFIGAADNSLMTVESLAIDPTDPDRFYVAAGNSPDWAINAVIFASRDRGKSFTRANLPFKLGGNDIGHMAGERLAVNPFAPNELYLATRDSGLWQSTNYGASWSRNAAFPITSSTDRIGLPFVRFDPHHKGTAYVATYGDGLFRTSDGGKTWQPVPNQPLRLRNGQIARPMRSAFGPDGTLYLTYSNTGDFVGINYGAVYKLAPNGEWTNITPPAPGGTLNYGFCALAVDTQKNGVVMVATWNRWYPGDIIYRSTDGGSSWTNVREHSVVDASLSPWVYMGKSEAEVAFGIWTSTMEIDPRDSNHAIFQGGNTVWATDNLTNMDNGRPVQWHIGSDGIEETVILSLISPPVGAHLLSGVGDEGGFRHDDFAVSPLAFQNPLMSEGSFLDFAEANPAVIARVGLVDYRGTIAGAYSLDGGSSWTPFANTPPSLADSPRAATGSMIAVSSDGKTIVWAPATAAPVFTRDRGTTWTASRGAPAKLRVVADRVNPNVFYGWDGATGTVYVSTDGGVSFAARAGGLPHDMGNLGWTNQAQPRTVAGHQGEIWLPLAGGLYRSSDAGATFDRANNVDSATLVAFGKAAPGARYPAVYLVGVVGGVYGIFRSDDAGVTWTRINDDAHQYGYIGVLAADPRIYGRVYLGTMGRGIIYGDIAR